MAGLARRWSLTVGPPFEPGGECAWVAPAVSATDGDVVLKVGWTHGEARDEAAGLRTWDGRGTVRLLDAVAEGETSALLLDRAVPGTPLSTRDGPEQDVMLAGLLRRLWVDPGAGHPFRPLRGCSRSAARASRWRRWSSGCAAADEARNERKRRSPGQT